MPSPRKRRPTSFDLPPAEEAPSGWTYRSASDEKEVARVERGGEERDPRSATRGRSLLDWAVWPVEFVLVLLFATLGARRRP